jgi:hypothetical protein
MIHLLAKCSNWKFIVPFFLLTTFIIYLFTQGENEISAIAGEEVTLIDLWDSYNLGEITSYFELIKEEGRAIHQRLTGAHDMIFPFAYGPLFILVFAFFLKNIFGEESPWILLALFPVTTMGVDYLENFNTLKMLSSFPNLSESLVGKGSSYLEIKNKTTLISNTLFVVLGIAWLAVTGKKYLQDTSP